jgi:hypothetical protein
LSPSAVEERGGESALLEAESSSLVQFSHVTVTTSRKEMSEEQVVFKRNLYYYEYG